MSKKFLNSMHEIGGILNWKISNFRSVGSGVNEQEVELAPLTIICGESRGDFSDQSGSTSTFNLRRSQNCFEGGLAFQNDRFGRLRYIDY